jgi:hypothetical protein
MLRKLFRYFLNCDDAIENAHRRSAEQVRVIQELMDRRTCSKCGAGKEAAIERPAPDPEDTALGGTVWICKHDGTVMTVVIAG